MTRLSLKFLLADKSMSPLITQPGLHLWIALLLATFMSIGHAANESLGVSQALNLPLNQDAATAKPAAAAQSAPATPAAQIKKSNNNKKNKTRSAAAATKNKTGCKKKRNKRK